MINGITTWISNNVQWAHQSMKELPVAGQAYTLFADNIGTPLAELGGEVKAYVGPFFNETYKVVQPKVRENPLVVGLLAGTMALIVVRAVYKHFYPTKP